MYVNLFAFSTRKNFCRKTSYVVIHKMFHGFLMNNADNFFREGDALFWINLNLNTGFSDRLTLHGGCPVAVGSKWITNKWIQYYDQVGFFFPENQPTNITFSFHFAGKIF